MIVSLRCLVEGAFVSVVRGERRGRGWGRGGDYVRHLKVSFEIVFRSRMAWACMKNNSAVETGEGK